MSGFEIDSEENLAIVANLLKVNDPTLKRLEIKAKSVTEVKTRLRSILPHIGNDLTHLKSISIEPFLRVYDDDVSVKFLNEEIAVLINKQIPCLNKIICRNYQAGICGAIAEPILNNSHIQNLHLTHCQICDKDAEILAGVLRHRQCALKELNLHLNILLDSGCCAIMDALHHNSSLRSLDLRVNQIGVEGCRAIGRALQNQSVTLEELDLSYNLIGDDGCICIANALTENTSLKKLHLYFCDISNKGWNAMKQALLKNYSLHQLIGVESYKEGFRPLLSLNRDKPIQAQATKTGMFPTQLLSSSKQQNSFSASCNAEMLGKIISFGNLSVLFSFIQEHPSFFECFCFASYSPNRQTGEFKKGKASVVSGTNLAQSRMAEVLKKKG